MKPRTNVRTTEAQAGAELFVRLLAPNSPHPVASWSALPPVGMRVRNISTGRRGVITAGWDWTVCVNYDGGGAAATRPDEFAPEETDLTATTPTTGKG